MFTKKHFDVIAEAIRAAHRQQSLEIINRGDYEHGVSSVANKLAEAFKQDNPRFDVFKFVEACTRE